MKPYIKFDLKGLRAECETKARAQGRTVSSVCHQHGINSSFFANSNRNRILNTGVMESNIGYGNPRLYLSVCDAFGIDPAKYDTEQEYIEPEPEEPKVESLTGDPYNDELLKILTKINENLDMLGRLTVQNYEDLEEIKKMWK